MAGADEGRGAAGSQGGSDENDVRCLQALRSRLDAELDLLALLQFAVAFRLDGGEVDEDVFPVFAANETIALDRIEPLHSASESIGHLCSCLLGRDLAERKLTDKEKTARPSGGISSSSPSDCVVHERHGITPGRGSQAAGWPHER